MEKLPLKYYIWNHQEPSRQIWMFKTYEELMKKCGVTTGKISAMVSSEQRKESYGNIISRIGAHLLNADQKRLRLWQPKQFSITY